MSDKKADTTDFSEFFREEAAEVLGLSQKNEGRPELTSPPSYRPPRLPEAQPAGDEERKAYWRKLRSFFRSGEKKQLPVERTGAFPALLAPFRNPEIRYTDFPFWIADEETFHKKERPGVFLQPLRELLQAAVLAFAPGDDKARILKDNLPRLELIIRKQLRMVDDTFKAAPVLVEALQTLEQQLAIKGDEREVFADDLARLRAQLPKTGLLLPFTPYTPLHLLAVFLRQENLQRAQVLRQEVQPLIKKLRDLLAVDKEKSPEARSPQQLQAGMDFADAFLKFDALSSVLPGEGAETMPADRRQRIEEILKTLDKAGALLLEADALLIFSHRFKGHWPFDASQVFPHAEVREAGPGKTSIVAVLAFDKLMEKAARVLAAVRIGKLEADGQYMPEIHDGFFAHFDWRSFTEAEMDACPPVLLLADAAELMEDELNDFSHILSTNRPVKVIAARGSTPREFVSGDPVFRQEPAALAVAHRNAYVMQASALAPSYLLAGFREGFARFAPALFYLLLPQKDEKALSDVYLWASAAVEGREFTGFRYDSERGPKWGSRFEVDNNPQHEADWPVHRLAFVRGEGGEDELEVSFTFADFAAQHLPLADQFHLVPPRFWTDDLVPLADFLALSGEEALAKVPFVWMVDDQDLLQKAAVAWPVVLTCRERLDFWHFLQENAGVHSYHVEQATEKLRQEIDAETARRIAELETAHQQEIEKVKEDTARAAMDRLAAVLLELELSDDILVATPRPPAPPVAEKAVEEAPASEPEPAPEPEEPEEEIMPLGEAWIDTPMCTSCNECRDINSKIFAYNADKQAYVANPKGGPFADIVRAAEKCPVGIIHPGAPQDPDEPDLEELVKRAERFN